MPCSFLPLFDRGYEKVWEVLYSINEDTEFDDADTGEKPILRRAILAAAGTIGSVVALPTVSADEHERTVEPDETIETPTCTEHVADYIECDAGTRPWATGAVTVIACPDCESRARVTFGATGGVSEDPCEQPTSNSTEMNVEPGERKTAWFDGNIYSLEVSQSNARIAINQNDCSLPE